MLRAAIICLSIAAAPGLRADLFVSSYGDNEIIDYKSSGALGSIISGSELKSPTGLAFDNTGNLYVSDSGTNQILKFNSNTGQYLGVFAQGGGLSSPNALAFGPDGNLYVASGNKVLEFNGQTGAAIGTFASGHGLSGATGLTFGPDHNLYVSSPGSNAVLEFNGGTGAFSKTFASGSALKTPGRGVRARRQPVRFEFEIQPGS